MPRATRTGAPGSRSWHLVVLVTLMLIALNITPMAGARTARASGLQQRRDSARRRRTEVVKQLNFARSSDTQMAARLSLLERQLHTQKAYADSVRSQADAATESVRRIRSDIADMQATVAEKKDLLTKRAVAEYMASEAKPFVAIADAVDLADAARRTSLLGRLAAVDGATIDQLDAARSALADREQSLGDAESRARARATEASRALRDVIRIVEQQRSTRAALEQRIKALQSEAAALAAQEAGVEALIRAHQGNSRTSRDGRVSGLGFAWPLHGTITSPYGPRWGGFHPGIDIADPRGTPISASKAGTVIYASWMDGYGNFVIIDHGGGYATAYGHQSRIATHNGAVVKQGEVIGYVGSTGHSTGNHLHFEVRVDGQHQDPMRYLP